MENEKRLLSLINSIKLLNTTRDLDEVLHQLIKEVSHVIEGASASVLFLYDQRLDKLYAKSAIGFDMNYLGKILLSPGEGMSGRTFLLNKGEIFPSASDTSQYMANLSAEAVELYAKSLGEMEYPMSAICVPLISKNQCIGVLTVDIFKENAQFDETDLQLLEIFAAQASIAIENAMLFSRNQRTKQIHEALTAVSLSKGGVEYITNSLSGLIRKDVAVFNEFMKPIAISGQVAKSLSNDLTKQYVSLLYESMRKREFSYHNLSLSGDSYLVYFFPIQADGLPMGLLTVFSEDNYELDPLDRFAIEQSSSTFAMEIKRQEHLWINEYDLSSSILEQLINTPYEEFSFNKLAKLHFPDYDKHHYVVAQMDMKSTSGSFQKVSDKKQQLIRLIYREISQLPFKVLVYEKNMEITLMFTVPPTLDEEQIFKRLSKLLSKIISVSKQYYQLSITVGLGQVVESLKRFNRSYHDAKKCLQYVQSIEQSHPIVTYKELGPHRLLLEIERSELIEYVDEMLGPIISYDKARDTELLKTLNIYLKSNQNMSQSAKKLFVHVNTIKYRLKTISDILIVENIKGEKVLELQLGLSIFDYLNITK